MHTAWHVMQVDEIRDRNHAAVWRNGLPVCATCVLVKKKTTEAVSKNERRTLRDSTRLVWVAHCIVNIQSLIGGYSVLHYLIIARLPCYIIVLQHSMLFKM